MSNKTKQRIEALRLFMEKLTADLSPREKLVMASEMTEITEGLMVGANHGGILGRRMRLTGGDWIVDTQAGDTTWS